MCPHGRGHWRYLANTTELVITSTHPSPQPKRQIDRFSHFQPIQAHKPNIISIGSAVFAQMTTECRYTLQWDAPLPLKIARSHGESGPHLIHGSLGPSKFSTHMASQSDCALVNLSATVLETI